MYFLLDAFSPEYRGESLCAIMESVADEKKNGALGGMVQAESMIQLALALPIGCVLGWFLGSLVDKHLHLHWVGVAGIILGAAGGFIQIYRTASKYLSRGE